MKVYVQNLKDHPITLEVEASDTIESVKKKFQDAEGIAAEQQKLMWRGNLLEDNKTLQDYEMHKDIRSFEVVDAQTTPLIMRLKE